MMGAYKFALYWFIAVIWTSFVLMIFAQGDPYFMAFGFFVFVVAMLGIFICLHALGITWMKEAEQGEEYVHDSSTGS